LAIYNKAHQSGQMGKPRVSACGELSNHTLGPATWMPSPGCPGTM